jgi:hypothetical protein
MIRLSVCQASVLSAVLLAACSGKGAGGSAASSAAPPDGGPAASLAGATFSVSVDGERVSGGAIDSMQIHNAAYTVPGPDNGPPTLLFYLADAKTADDANIAHTFRIQVPKAMGVVAPAYIKLDINTDPDHLAQYTTSKAAVTITSLDARHVAGTFSSPMENSPDTPNVKKNKIVLTDGTFDIPMATSKLTPP